MKKTLLALILGSTFVVAGCSSSNHGNNDHVVDRPEPTDPSFGIPLIPTIPDIDDSEKQRPDLDTSPEWGLDIGDTPDWGGVIGDIHVDNDGVVRFEGNEYQIVAYHDMDREFELVDSNGETLFARVRDDGMIGVIYKQQVYLFNFTRFAFTPDYDFGVDTNLDYVAKDDITSVLNLQKEIIKAYNQDDLIGEYLKYGSGVYYDQDKMEQAAFTVVAFYLTTDADLDLQHKLGALAFSFNGNVSIAHSLVVDALKHIDKNVADSDKQTVLRSINDYLGTEHESIQSVYEGVYRHGQDMLSRLGVSGNEGNRYTIALIRNIQRHGWDNVKGKIEDHIKNNPQPMQINAPARNIDRDKVRSEIRHRISQ
ncbi:hypothetical protein [Enterovibrio norvegicus]|uniref:WG containing repeat-containing protein n=1 Tax=Enterovibrio norvegicus DSM 15893 TaxID=1121869 RepID=A0A1I5RMG6_9GAMM|nr:hypothetical protein [Enterovibrio norvegicus]SFP59683.1 hypothetical protein SAMN03084138_02605 [Enterovibrio norvegicus DSM 15893]